MKFRLQPICTRNKPIVATNFPCMPAVQLNYGATETLVHYDVSCSQRKGPTRGINDLKEGRPYWSSSPIFLLKTDD